MSVNNSHPVQPVEWKWYEKVSFRVFVLYIIVLLIPLDAALFERVGRFDWANLTFRNVATFPLYFPSFANNATDRDFTPVGIVFGACAAVGLVWSYFDRNRPGYTVFYYWMRVLIRYRIAMAMFYFAFVKIFPVQMPFPSLSHLNTALGDFTPGTLFGLTTGASPAYERFVGITELFGAVLLLFPRSATLGMLWVAAVMVPVTAINFIYDYGVHHKCINILLMALFFLAHDRKVLIGLFVQGAPVQLAHPVRLRSSGWIRGAGLAAKVTVAGVFGVFFAFKVAQAYYRGEPFQHASRAGIIDGIEGFYDATLFIADGDTLAGSDNDPVRWQNVIFDEWNTMSIKVSRPVQLLARNEHRKIEHFGAAGRHYYSYRASESRDSIWLYTHPVSLPGPAGFRIDRQGDRLALSGTDEAGRALRVVLDKVDRRYPLVEGRYPATFTVR